MFAKYRMPGVLLLAAMFIAFAGIGSSASGLPLAISGCGTIAAPGQYTLGGNISTSGNCLLISASNVSIDLKNHTITGDGSGSAITDGGVAQSQIIIANGKIRNFSIGVSLGNSGTVTVQNLDSSNNTNTGIYISKGTDFLNQVKANNNSFTGIVISGCCNTLSNVQAISNGSAGLVATGCCSYLTNATISNNHSGGAVMTDCCNSVVNSKVTNNQNGGVVLTGGHSFVSGITASQNTNGGIVLPDGFNSVSGSKAAGNTNGGIVLTGSFNTVSTSSATKNTSVGIVLSGGGGNRSTNCTASKNSGNGLVIQCPGNVANLVAKGNPTGNLVEISPASCANLNNNAP